MRMVELAPHGMEDLLWWVQNDRKIAIRILKLLLEIERDPFTGTGEPEPLQGDVAGAWARRIGQEHRLVYTVTQERIRVLACRDRNHR